MKSYLQLGAVPAGQPLPADEITELHAGILTRETMPRWMGSEPLPEEDYRVLTQPLPAEQMEERPVSRFVNNSRNEGPQCHAPPEEGMAELALG